MQDTIDTLRSWLTREHTSTEAALESAVTVYQDCAATITQLQAVQAESKLLIAEIFAETGRTEAATKAGRVYITKPALLISYDAKGIDGLAALDEELAALLEPFRRQTERAGTMTIRALGNGQESGK